jgi:prepilin-type processing-associated H-X9-DG protein
MTYLWQGWFDGSGDQNGRARAGGALNTAGGGYSEGRPIAAIPAVATTILVAENPRNNNAFGNNNGSEVGQPAWQTNPPPVGLGRPLHFDGYNYLFCDGHVKWLRPENTVDGNPNDSLVGTMEDAFGMWTIEPND